MNDTYNIDYDFYNCCYECGTYGDDYSYDIETDSYVSNCYDCPLFDYIEDPYGW